MSSAFSFLFHMIGVVALILHFLVLKLVPYVYKWYHTPFDRYEIDFTEEDDRKAAVIAWFVFLIYFLWCCLGVFTFQWYLYLPLALSCLIFKKSMSAPVFRWRSALSILVILLILVNYTHYGISLTSNGIKVNGIDEVVPKTETSIIPKKPVTIVTPVRQGKKGVLKWQYGRGFFMDTTNGLQNLRSHP